MKLRIVEPGWANFTGPFGVVEFVDGVSVEDVSSAEVHRLAGLVAVEDADKEGVNPSLSQRIIDRADLAGGISADVPIFKADDAANGPRPAEPGKIYTSEELGKIADDNGIRGIREISEPLGLKDTSIAALISKILQAQADAKSAKSGQAAQEAIEADKVAAGA